MSSHNAVHHSRRRLLGAGLFGVASLAAPALAQNTYPNRPIVLIVPFPPGGVTDLVARELAKRLSDALGQSVVVENRAGAGGNIGTAALAKASPDGYTLGVMTVSAMSIAPHIHKSLPFQPLKDFTPISNIVNTPGAIVAGLKTPFQNLQDLIKAAKANPGRISYASVGLGSLPHLAAEMFAQQAGVQLLHVPYKGAAPAMQDLLSGVVDLTFESALTNTVTHFSQGKLKVLATTGSQRVPILPQVPSANEVLPGYTAQGWFGFFGPAGLPTPIATKLNEVAVAMLREPALLERFEKLGIQADPSAPVQFARYLQEQDRLWAGATKGLNLQLD